MAKVLLDEFGIEKGLMTTIHAYTNDQKILDFPHTDLRRTRAAAINMIPTSTGAAKAIGLVLPDLKGKLDGYSMRVPVPTGSATDLTVQLSPRGHQRRGQRGHEGRVRRCTQGLSLATPRTRSSRPTSSLIPSSCIIDAGLTNASGDLVKVVGWYDNEWGYSNRLVDLVELVGSAL